jgi:16S rRNA (uracil1498-N3)-methyltransferase
MPRPPRFFISPDQISGARITVTDEDVRHIATVLRMKAGDELLLCDGQGTDYTARIALIEKARIIAEIETRRTRDLSPLHVTLGQGIPKSDKMDWVVQKATELGVSSIAPLITERTIVKVRDEEKRAGRWRKICREAAMQSSRPDIPLIEPIRSFHEFVLPLAPGPSTLLLFPWEDGMTPLKEVLRTRHEVKKIVVLIGPEGGFSQAEADLARGAGFHLVSLGPNILRAETAAIVALSMILYETGSDRNHQVPVKSP